MKKIFKFNLHNVKSEINRLSDYIILETKKKGYSRDDIINYVMYKVNNLIKDIILYRGDIEEKMKLIKEINEYVFELGYGYHEFM
jgi:hypothetical protein